MPDEAQQIATEVAIKAAGGIGRYLADAVGSIPKDALGLLVGDWLGHKRQRQLALLEATTARILEGIAAERITEPSPSVFIPLLQAAIDEGRPELQTMWAALLANAMTDGGNRVRRDYFEALRAMEPVDAAVLDIISRRLNPHSDEITAADADVRFIEQERLRLGIAPDDLAIAVSKLVKLDCVLERHPVRAAPNVTFSGPQQPRAYPPSLTPFGRGLLAACKPPN